MGVEVLVPIASLGQLWSGCWATGKPLSFPGQGNAILGHQLPNRGLQRTGEKLREVTAVPGGSENSSEEKSKFDLVRTFLQSRVGKRGE